MRINQNTVLKGKRVTLVPYTSAHVPRYHEWMKSEELQRLTASEPLSLEQEYEMQCSWQEDADKVLQKSNAQPQSAVTFSYSLLGDLEVMVQRIPLVYSCRIETKLILSFCIPLLLCLNECTFIILDTEKWSRQSATEEDCMVGDVNLFLTDSEDPSLAEIEVMIGEASYRGRGFGTEATQLMMCYGMTQLGLITFEAKIGLENKASISMFKKLHFKEVGVNSVFQEVTLRLKINEQEKGWLLEQTSHVEEKKLQCHETPESGL